MNTSLTYTISEIFCITYIPKYIDYTDIRLNDELIVFNWITDVIR